MKDKIITIIFVSYILIFSILHLTIKDNNISTTERRKLASFPNFEIKSDYITKLDKYFLDHFPFRDSFRSIKAKFNYNVLKKYDNNGIYLSNKYIFKSNYPTNKQSINKFINNIEKIKNMFNNSNFYIMIIPDKNYYLDDNNFLQVDYDYIYDEMKKLNIKSIDIRNILSLQDYYETDTHWKQENLDKIIKRMSYKMNFNYENINYKKNTYNNFYGVYYNESGIKRNPETLTYLTNPLLDLVNIFYLENKELNKVYNETKLNGLDSYEVFLDGASSYIEIVNNYSINDKELIVFRDSFGSSLIPLFINYYKKITVIDNRYINSGNFLKYIDLNNQDILFIYSTLLINDSYSLKG